MLLAGVRAGLIWTLVIVAIIAGNTSLGYMGVFETNTLDEEMSLFLSGASQSMLGVVMFVLCGFYEAAKNQSLSALDVANADMRFVLNNVDQGFINTDGDGCIVGHRSSIVETWFGEISKEIDIYIWDIIRRVEPFQADMMQIVWEQLKEDTIPTEVSLSQLPQRIVVQEKQLNFDYQIIRDDKEKIQSIIIMIVDISAEVRQELLEAEHKENQEVIKNFTRDREGFTRFFNEGSGLVESIQDRESNLYGLLHTLKGNCGIFGVRSVARVCHDLEEELKLNGDIEESSILRLEEVWSVLSDRMTVVLRGFKGKLEIPMHAYLALLEAIQSGASPQALFKLAESWRFESTRVSFERLEQQVHRMARALNKLPVTVQIEDNGVFLDPEQWQPFWSAIIHVVRNAVDHGLEGPDRREELGKPSHATIRFRSSRLNDTTIIEISDDGAGIDWEKLRDKALANGVSQGVVSQDIELLFLDGVSSKEQVSEYSGRGVGAGAFRLACRQMGGEVSVLTVLGKGTTFRVTVPDHNIDGASLMVV